ncbi:MAG: GCN5-related N-acetyltransferase [Candidatus Solibacter sp.]|jgi:GNAT superfamily N-acetyltransferase|nr:GCN5-related N-acetyltransferase [Candidatus Solibacter sp.]
MDEIRIRPATPSDIPHVVLHRKRMFADMGRGTEADREAMGLTTAAYLRDAMPSGKYRGWLAETSAGDVVSGVGVAIYDWPGSPDDPAQRRGIVINVYTEPEFRRRGIARRLMDTLVEWCRAEGFGSVALHASKDGRPLYEAMGFQPTNEMRLKFVQRINRTRP